MNDGIKVNTNLFTYFYLISSIKLIEIFVREINLEYLCHLLMKKNASKLGTGWFPAEHLQFLTQHNKFYLFLFTDIK